MICRVTKSFIIAPTRVTCKLELWGRKAGKVEIGAAHPTTVRRGLTLAY